MKYESLRNRFLSNKVHNVTDLLELTEFLASHKCDSVVNRNNMISNYNLAKSFQRNWAYCLSYNSISAADLFSLLIEANVSLVSNKYFVLDCVCTRKRIWCVIGLYHSVRILAELIILQMTFNFLVNSFERVVGYSIFEFVMSSS